MSLIGQKTTTSFIEWDTLLSLIQKLERDKDYKFTLFLSIGMYTGLRIGDILQLKWKQLLENSFQITEKKTGKFRSVKVNNDLQTIIKRIQNKLDITNTDQFIFINKYKEEPFKRAYVNQKLKRIFKKYNVKYTGNISSHMLRKSLGRRVMEQNKYSGESLILLSELFNHSSVSITKIYLGIRKEEVDSIYDCL